MTEWDGKRKWHRGRRVSRSDVRVGMWLSCGDEQYKPSRCWQDNHPQCVESVGDYTCYIQHRRQDGVLDTCECNDLDHLYEVVWDIVDEYEH